MKIIKNILFCILFCVFAISCSGGKEGSLVGSVGSVLPDWQEGYLDIHSINTGRGESTLYIFPDGTTMLVDASSSLIPADHPIPPVDAKPNASAVSGETITNYVSHFVKAASNKLNYIMVTHWHPDHIGGFSTSLPQHSSGKFLLNGITTIGANIRFDKIIDRGYTYPGNLSSYTDVAGIPNYIDFVEWSQTEYSAEREEFISGVTDQITLKQNPSGYDNFCIRNIIGNGLLWTGEGTQTRNLFPENHDELEAAKPPENIFSLGFHLKYGKFDYFAGGDLQRNNRSTHAWFDVESPVADVMQRVEVLKANHHATSNCHSDVFINKLKPDAVVVTVWRDPQPNPETIKRIFDANSDCHIFLTNITDANKERLNSHTPDITSKFKSLNGHVVVRVAPGGDSYYIYVLDDTNEEYIVSEIFGPYQCN